MSETQADKGVAFRTLHEGEPFVIPNPWDAGSAKMLESLGFKALATTSGGFAFTLGRHDGDVTLEDVLAHVASVADATALPVSVDLENGYGPSPEQAATAISGAAQAGAVGGSIEDWDPADMRLYAKEEATERIAAATEAAGSVGFQFTLTARAENHLRGNPDIADTIARLQAYEAAGANVLYAPGLRTAEEVRTVCDAVTAPVNALGFPGLDVKELFAAGAQRISIGSQLSWVAVAAAADAAERLRDGDLGALKTRPRVKEWLGDG